MLLSPLLSLLLASVCSAEYYHVIGEDFNDYIGDSFFHIENFVDISIYGIPPPPGGNNAAYLTDTTMLTQTHIIHIPSSQEVNFQFTFFCDDSPSQLEIRMSYPWEAQNVVLCGLNSPIAQPGFWVTETFTRECYSNCTYIDLWLYGNTIEEGDIVGIHSLSITTEDSTFAPTDITQSTTTTVTTTTTTTTPTTTPEPACYSPGTSCASGHGTCRTSCDSNEYEYGSECGGASCRCCKLGWPYGRYGLPEAYNGCPDNSKFSWGKGYTSEDTEGLDGGVVNWMHFDSGSHRAGKNYCIKTSSSSGVGDWPAGDYCIYRYGGSCPTGFTDGSIRWEDRDLHGDNSYGGYYPDGPKSSSDTWLVYCCRNDGSPLTSIKLPTEHTFILMRNNKDYCQRVYGMDYETQDFRVDTENTGDDSESHDDIPFTCSSAHGECVTWGIGYTRDPQVHYCAYH